MRYIIITYFKRPNGQMDEQIGAVKRIKTRDLQTASVILDFQKQQVIKASMQGETLPKDWWHIRDYYHGHYKTMIEDIERANVLVAVPVDTSTDASKETTVADA